jgi:hypothetical protein
LAAEAVLAAAAMLALPLLVAALTVPASAAMALRAAPAGCAAVLAAGGVSEAGLATAGARRTAAGRVRLAVLAGPVAIVHQHLLPKPRLSCLRNATPRDRVPLRVSGPAAKPQEKAGMTPIQPTAFPVSGGCQCGAVRYTLLGPAEAIYHCHCSICRKLHGAVFVSFATCPPQRLRLDRGADELASFCSSPGSFRRFCRRCGCHLFCDVDNQPWQRWFLPATLDGGADPGNPPGTARHIFYGSKVAWYAPEDGLPRCQAYPP